MLEQLDIAIIWDWLSFAARWLHVITGIAWIGSSFYFIALDLGLRRSPNLPDGVHGEEWQVHGGGFYHIRKYLVAPPEMPDHLTWFKWESYSTWLSGLVLLMIIYWAGAELYLIDRNKMDLEIWHGILISGASLAIGWLVYDYLCRTRLGDSPTILMLLLFVLLIVMAWGYNQVFTGRAALLHIGAFTATIMTANVFFIIIPNQKIVVNDLKAGRTPNAKYGKIGKLRSTHNNYLTLPVIFLMLANHYPLAFATEYNWIICSLVFLMGVSIRHYFNTLHARKGNPHWTWALTALIFIFIMWLSALRPPESHAATITANETQKVSTEQVPSFAEIRSIVEARCLSCHSREPLWKNVYWAPRNVLLDSDDQIMRFASQIYMQAGISEAMPPANVTFMETSERENLIAWYRQYSRTKLSLFFWHE